MYHNTSTITITIITTSAVNATTATTNSTTATIHSTITTTDATDSLQPRTTYFPFRRSKNIQKALPRFPLSAIRKCFLNMQRTNLLKVYQALKLKLNKVSLTSY